MSFGKKLMMTDMTTRRPMDSEDPTQCHPGRFPLYVLAAGKTDYFSIYRRALEEGVSIISVYYGMEAKPTPGFPSFARVMA